MKELREFKRELLFGIKLLLINEPELHPKKWLRSSEVQEILGVSSSTLQNLRINGTLPYSRVGGVLYYDPVEIMKIMEYNKVSKHF